MICVQPAARSAWITSNPIMPAPTTTADPRAPTGAGACDPKAAPAIPGAGR